MSTKLWTVPWFHIGDFGTLNSGGNLTVTGRIKELINRGGEKIPPAHAEGVLGAFPGVTEAAVFGVLDAKYGERPRPPSPPSRA